MGCFPNATTVFLYRQAECWARSAVRAFGWFSLELLAHWTASTKSSRASAQWLTERSRALSFLHQSFWVGWRSREGGTATTHVVWRQSIRSIAQRRYCRWRPVLRTDGHMKRCQWPSLSWPSGPPEKLVSWHRTLPTLRARSIGIQPPLCAANPAFGDALPRLSGDDEAQPKGRMAGASYPENPWLLVTSIPGEGVLQGCSQPV